MREELVYLLADSTLGEPVSERAGAWGVAALSAGVDTPAVRVLAGFTGESEREDVVTWLRRAALERAVRLPTFEESREIRAAARATRARSIAADMVDGAIGLIEGSWQLAGMASTLGSEERGMRLLWPFVGVTCETDPSAGDRKHWNAEALRAKDEEARAYEAAVRRRILAACRALVEGLQAEAERVARFLGA